MYKHRYLQNTQTYCEHNLASTTEKLGILTDTAASKTGRGQVIFIQLLEVFEKNGR